MNAPRTHTVPTGTMGAALLASGAAAALAFDFALIDVLKDIHVHEFGNLVLSSTAFACDAYINNTLRDAMTKLRAEQELAGTASWDSYQAFLSFAAGIAANEQLMSEAGMEIKPLRETIQKLYTLRTDIHNVLLERIGSKYETPDITDWMRNPKLQQDSPDTQAKKKNTNRMLATDFDTGVIDVDLEKQLTESQQQKDIIEKQDQLKWDKQRGELHAMMFHALKIREDMHEVGYTDEFDPFGSLSAEHQFKLLASTEQRYVPTALTKLAKDRKVPYTLHAAATVEAQRLLKAVRVAMKHPRFKNVQV